MNMGNYAHGNQPIQHMIYLYAYSDTPWKAQHWLREVMTRQYHPSPDGYCGDEDNGQTSAWYVFSALGFYPVCPGSNQYVIGAPFFTNAKLHLENGKTLTIEATDNSDRNRFIREATFNGVPFTKSYLTHEDILKGGFLNFKMGDAPDKERGTKNEDRPYSLSTAEK